MPVVRISLYEVRSPEKQRQIAELITEAPMTIGGAAELAKETAG